MTARGLCAIGLLVLGTTVLEDVAVAGRLEIGDIANLVRVSDPQLSPDGKSIVFVVSRPDLEEARYHRQLIWIDVATGRQRPLTYDRRGVSHPRWSPSGDRIAFLDPAPPAPEPVAPGASPAAHASPSRAGPASSAARYQIFVMPMTGGEPHRITYATQDVEQLAWSPDGTQIAYVVADDNPRKQDIEKHDDAFEVGDNDYLTTEQTMPSHVWLVPAEGGRARRLTSGSWSLPKAPPSAPPVSPLSWAPDGQSLAVVQQATPYWANLDQAVIAAVNVADGRIRKLTGHKALEGYPAYSPDGRSIAYLYPRDGDFNNGNDLVLTDGSGESGAAVTRQLDRNIVRAIWTPAGDALIVAAHDAARVQLWRQPRTGRATKIDLGDLDPTWSYWVDLSMARDGGMAVAGSTPTHPNEIYYVPAGGGAPRRLTAFNQEIASRALGRTEELTWQGADGMAEDGVVVYPPDLQSGRKYPLVLLIHGGPMAASTLAFNPLAHWLAAHDYIVFLPNYRGSDNLGNAYTHAIVNDAGEGPGRDIMAGIQALEHRGNVDRLRMAVSGWSYGGYLTSWLTGHFQIWKAAVSGAAVNDWVHGYALSDLNVATRYAFGGPPWSAKLARAYRDQSSITYADRITTPTLILSNTGDARVPISQSYLMYHALKDHGVTVQFIAYPVAGHAPSDPVRTSDVYRRWLEWIDRHLKRP